MTRRRGAAAGRVHRRRAAVLRAAFVAAAAAFSGRAVQLQFVQADTWRARAESQSTARDTTPAVRGGIYDREGRPLAVWRSEWRAFYAPREAADRQRTVTAIAGVVPLSRAQIRRLRGADRGWVAVPGLFSGAERERLERAVGPGLHFEAAAGRLHPEGELAGSLLGRLGPDGRGLSGLELELDSLLRGWSGEVRARRDARGALYADPETPVAPGRPGMDVRLTIDLELQAIAEATLEEALQETGAAGGDVIMADPRSGELLAVASRRQGSPHALPAFTDPWEPGSTAKPFLLAALLSEGAADLHDRVYAEHGEWRTGSRVIRDVHPYDTLTVAEVIRFSSNIGAAKLAARLSPGAQYRYLRDFGLGTPTGVAYPAESPGLLRRPAEWSGLSQASLSFGYELLVTSVQLVAAYGALANDGVLVRPGLIREVRRPDGTLHWRRRVEPIRRVIEPEVAARITGVLGSVVQEGTGELAGLRTLRMAGKTGTTRTASDGGYRERRYVASFVGYVPAEDPKMVVLAKLDDPQGRYYGGALAAPVSRTVVQAALATPGSELVPPRVRELDPRRFDWGRATAGPYRLASAVGGEVRLPPPASGEEVILPDLRGLPVRAAVARLHQLGLEVEVRGGGAIERQQPAPGTKVIAGGVVRLR